MNSPCAVVCECGRTTPVTEKDMGFKVTCGCTLVIVVPLKEEFERSPVLKTAVTIPKRIERLYEAGELVGGECGGCGT
jgi:hypothetical protein